MMSDRFYLPLLKSKAGEFAALAKIDASCKEKIFPLFEVTHNEWDHNIQKKPKTLKEHLINFCKKVIKSWPSNRFFIDTNLIVDKDIDGNECIEFIFEELAKKKIYPIPVVYVSSPRKLFDAIALLKLLYPVYEIAIRVTIEDIISSDFEKNVNDIFDLLDLPAENCHLIFDLKDADFSQIEDFSDSLIDVLKEFPKLDHWKSFTLAGGAFPVMSKIKKSTDLVPRGDWLLYHKVLAKMFECGLDRIINFGDYSIVAPGYIEFDPRKMSVSANIRYTHDNVWYVVKGRALKKSVDWQQYYNQAKQIADSTYYLGEHFSLGDQHIKSCAEKKTTTGNSNVWIEVGNIHHFTKVIRDLFSMTA